MMQSRQATGRLASDDRNPYAYVPTSQDIETLVPWLREVGQAAPDGPLEPVAVIGTGYWPLPWYLRSFAQIGYWQEPQKIADKLDRFPLVFAVPETADALRWRWRRPTRRCRAGCVLRCRSPCSSATTSGADGSRAQ